MTVSAFEAALIETWTLFAVGSIVIMMRIFCRTKMVGFAGYCGDDYLIFFAWACYTAMTVAAHIVGGTGDTSHLTLEQRLSFSPEEAAMRQKGTKWFMVGWYTYIGLIWTLKFNFLFLSRRIVSVSHIRIVIIPTMAFVGATGVAIWILFATACRPFHKLWQILPDPGRLCMPQSPVFLITVLVLNFVTDMCIIIIPIPIILPLRITWARKIGIIFMFSAGIFVMIAAVLRVYFVLSLQQGQTAAIWSCRKDFVAIVIGQATMVRPLFTHRFWTRVSTNSSTYELSGGSFAKTPRLGFRTVKDPYHVSVLRTQGNESEEHIISGGSQKGVTAPCNIRQEDGMYGMPMN
ncbi:hypothetical protein HBI81_020770 [Parastagonospora nodorum]|nr:hypothetical protein HBI74_169070 [Parastagonospora nodorum]KAH6544248.1 hypothetical protein HBI81_020770 [Parastagonospora nodorum]